VVELSLATSDGLSRNSSITIIANEIIKAHSFGPSLGHYAARYFNPDAGL
jgi:hypothetical protein